MKIRDVVDHVANLAVAARDQMVVLVPMDHTLIVHYATEVSGVGQLANHVMDHMTGLHQMKKD